MDFFQGLIQLAVPHSKPTRDPAPGTPPELIERLSRFNNDLTIGSPPTTKEKGRWHDDISSLALGMYQYRRGDLKEALQLLPWHDEWYPHHDVVSLLFQSMAHARLGESDQAKACYESAVRIQTYDVPPRGAVHFRVYKGWPLWYIWARYDFVRSQADEVLASCGVLARDSIESTLPVPGGAFVVLAGDGAEVAKFDTLAEAVLGSTAGDTIEIRGNGPFITDPMQISHPLRIQAAAGFHPVIKANPEKALSFERPLLAAGSPLVLVGLDLRATTGGVDDDWGDLVVSTAPLQVANCSLLVQQKVGHCIWSSSSALLRNCELIGPAPYAYAAKSNEQFAIDNSLLIGMNQTHEFDGTDISLRLSGNTMLRAPGRHAVLGFFFQSLADGPPESPPDKPIRVVASGNIVDSAHNAFKVWWDTPDVQRHLSGAEAKALLPRLIDWRETGNLYRAGNFLAMQWAGNEEDICGQDLEEWNRFWGLTDTGSTQGLIRYEGGDLRAKALSNPEQLTPDDFRLRPDSAGYRAGPDGKDLGADVDLVGPGEAYERWKKTPEYEAWQKETRELMKAAVADQPDGEAVSEADTAEQSEAAGSEADQRPVEKPAEEQTATSGS